MAPSAIADALGLWNRSEELVRGERSLFALQGCFAGFDPSSTLLKLAALTSFDAGRARSLAPLFDHVQSVIERCDMENAGPEFVDALATTPPAPARSEIRELGFASRFAHYFVDSERFPILDGWSERALAGFVGDATPSGATRYGRFFAEHARLTAACSPVRSSELGRCLWLAGQHAAWSRNSRTPIHRAARELFASGAPELAALHEFTRVS
ncbi:MAG: hypothetical protein K8S98_09975 [Planctomycetes bacterium]|nr:hypothetical protein [Planctomycetota bacterium]